MKKQLLIIAALFAVIPAFAAPSAFNPRYLLPAITGVQGEHLATENLLQNILPQAAALIEKGKVKAHLQESPAAASMRDKYAQTSNYIKTEMLCKYLFSHVTPIGRRAPKGFHQTRTQQAAALLAFARPAICNQVGNQLGTKSKTRKIVAGVVATAKQVNKINDISKAVIFALKHLPAIKARQELADRLAHKNILVSSWSVPAHMRGKNYLMFHGPYGYALKHLPNLLFVAKEIAEGWQHAVTNPNATRDGQNHGFGHRFAGQATCKISRAQALFIVKMLPFISLTTKYYLLESDYQKLSQQDQVAVYQAVHEDVTNFSDSLVNLLAPAFKQENYDAAKAWGTAVQAEPIKKLILEPKDAVVAQAQALPTKWNDLVTYAQSFKPASAPKSS